MALALTAGTAVAAPSKFTVNSDAAPGANVTRTYNHNAFLDCDRGCYGFYLTEFPSMSDTGVIAGRLPVSAYIPPKLPIYEPPVNGPTATSDGVAAVWENGTVKQLGFPLVFRSTGPGNYVTYQRAPVAGMRAWEVRGCRDTDPNSGYWFWDGNADGPCGSRALAVNNAGIVAGSTSEFPPMDTGYFERGYVWGSAHSTSWNGKYSSPLWTNTTNYPHMAGFSSQQQDTATAINNLGSVVGTGIESVEKIRVGFYRLSDGTAGNIGQVVRTDPYTIIGTQVATATSINSKDTITGGAQKPNADGKTFDKTTAYVFKFSTVGGVRTGRVTAWGAYPGASMTQGYDINDNDLVVGRYWKALTDGSVNTRGFYWNSANGTIADVGDLDGSSTKESFTVARSVNNKGNVVGTSRDSTGAARGFLYLWADKKMYDLNSYLSNPLSGWTIVDAYTINEKGEVLVRAESSTGSAYWSLRPNGIDQAAGTASAELVSPNSKVSASIGSGGDNDYFKIVLPVDGTFTVYTTGSTDTFCHLFDGAGKALATNDDKDGTTKNCRITGYRAAGTYFGRIRHASSSGTGSYAFLSTFGPDDGDTANDGTPIVQASSVSAKIDTAGDIDFFTLYVDAAKTMTIKTTGNVNTVCDLQSTNGDLIKSNNDGSPTNTNCSITHDFGSPGIYHVKTRHNSASGTGTYTLVTQ